jgi:uncharacterized membrane protein
VATSILAVVTNPVPMAGWGLIVAGGLVLGSLPALLGLIFVMPVLGHATWHLYRKVVPANSPPPSTTRLSGIEERHFLTRESSDDTA